MPMYMIMYFEKIKPTLSNSWDPLTVWKQPRLGQRHYIAFDAPQPLLCRMPPAPAEAD